MNSKWVLTLFAAVPFTAALLALQSCGGEGGSRTDDNGLPSVTAQFMALLSDEQRDADYIGSDSCATAGCHGAEILDHWKETAHADRNVSCERCHGPGEAHQANPTKENILTFPKSTSPVVCAQCHGPTHEQFTFSAHSKLIASPMDSAIGNPGSAKSSRCMTCHSGLVRTQIVDKGINFGTLPDDQVRALARDTLDNAPWSASCVTCHNPHQNTGNTTDTGAEVMLRHKTFNNDTSQVAPGTTAAQFTTFDHICAQCHNGRGADPADAKLQSGTSRPNMHDSNQYNMMLGFGGVEDTNDGPVQRNTEHANIPGQCSKCHMPDSSHTFTVSFDKSCSPCHTPTDAATRLSVTKDEVVTGLINLRSRLESWAVDEFGDPDLWDYTSLITEEGKTPPNQANVPIEVKRARHNYYFVIRSGDYGAHNAPYAKYLIFIANKQLDRIGVNSPNLVRSRGLSTGQKLAITERDAKRAREADIKQTGEH